MRNPRGQGTLRGTTSGINLGLVQDCDWILCDAFNSNHMKYNGQFSFRQELDIEASTNFFKLF